jgi:hypothetical protein
VELKKVRKKDTRCNQDIPSQTIQEIHRLDEKYVELFPKNQSE